MTVDLPTARDYLKSSVRLTIWCKACGHQIEMEFGEFVEKARAMCRSLSCASAVRIAAVG